ncbi:MAG: M20 family metallopeptidase [Mycoplasmoidaceae bacterium]|nr:MAG: M20 family metallopeptidase [Mycoplasmoidaceae bacterium]
MINNKDTIKKINELVNKNLGFVFDSYKHIHKNPELGWDVKQTCAYVCKYLKENNISYKILNKTGVVALIKGKKPGKCILLRGDMDALPITEQTDVSYKSLIPGKMHACGHDAHTSNLLGCALIINQMKEYLNGSVKFMFQPNEEGEGGAKKMIDLGALKNPKVDAALAIHCGDGDVNYKEGNVVIKDGAPWASLIDFIVTFVGKSGHISNPKAAIDPNYPASELVVQINELSKRTIKSNNPSILGVASIISSTNSTNIIPDKVVVKGCIRSIDQKLTNKLKIETKKLIDNISKKFKIKTIVDFDYFAPTCVNDKKLFNLVKNSSIEILGKQKVQEMKKQTMGAEDFAYISQCVPSCNYNVQLDKDSHWHNSKMKINPNIYFPTALKSMIMSVFNYLNNN